MMIETYFCSSITDLLPVCNFKFFQFSKIFLIQEIYLQIGDIVQTNFQKLK
jgi:hypothetical protein